MPQPRKPKKAWKVHSHRFEEVEGVEGGVYRLEVAIGADAEGRPRDLRTFLFLANDERWAEEESPARIAKLQRDAAREQVLAEEDRAARVRDLPGAGEDL